jgi:NitT/TauT family transport system permease protein
MKRTSTVPRRYRISRRETVALRLVVLATILAFWQVIGNDSIRFAMPTFTRTAAAFIDLAGSGDLLAGLLVSNESLAYGFTLALAIGIPLGIGIGSSRLVERLARPYLLMVLALPVITVLPIIQAIFGLSVTARVALVFIASFVYVAANTAAGVESVDAQLPEMARSYGATRWQATWQVVVPAAVPAIMAGIRLGLSRAVIGMVIAELFLAGAGVGSLIVLYETKFDSAYVFALGLSLVLEGVLLAAIATRIERALGAWRGVDA